MEVDAGCAFANVVKSFPEGVFFKGDAAFFLNHQVHTTTTRATSIATSRPSPARIAVIAAVYPETVLVEGGEKGVSGARNSHPPPEFF